jgi:hypothetical protein
MIARLDKVNSIITDDIDKPMLLCDAPRPHAWSKILQGFRLAHPSKWVAHNCLDQREDTEGGASFSLYPIAQVFTKLWLKDCIT